MAAGVTPPPAAERRVSSHRALWLVVVVVLIFAGALAFGIAPRLTHQKALLAASREEADQPALVNYITVRPSTTSSELTLPGSIEAIYDAPIYARADGYLRTLNVDIGDHVKAGQLLGEIQTPELDQQLLQASAAVKQSQAALKQAQAAQAQAKANLAIAKLTLDRWDPLLKSGAVSKQETDEKQAAFDARTADEEAAQANIAVAASNITANQANVARLTELKSFDRLTAPFDGVITVRNTIAGTLISAGTNSPNHELLRIAKTDVLRTFVSVPQSYAESIHPGEQADILLEEMPNRPFRAKVSRFASSLDPASRTMRTEVQVQNENGLLLPGMYAQVRFRVGRQNPPVLIPSDTMIVRSDGTQVALVTPDNKVHFQRIELGRDYGADVEVVHGLAVGQKVIVNPTDDVREGIAVEARPLKTARL